MLDAADRIEAMERLDRIEDEAVGSGMVKTHETRRLIARLGRRASGHQRSAESLRKSATVQEIESAGVQVVIEENE